MHLFARDSDDLELGLSALLALLGLYTLCTIMSFGIDVPFGTFIPSLTVGAALGRVLGQLLMLADLAAPEDRGSFALVRNP